MTIEALLNENEARLARIQAPYDPLEGATPGKIDLLRCERDFEYWAATCCHIKNKRGGDDILFRLNRPQRKMVAMFERMRTLNRPIRVILLKARQWGGSTCVQLYMAWLQMMKSKGLNSLIIAHQHSATSEIRDMFMRMIGRYPEALHPEEDEGKGRRPEYGVVSSREDSPERAEGEKPRVSCLGECNATWGKRKLRMRGRAPSGCRQEISR